ncbi:MAG: L-histidine N(alpha)-methyltransferase [Thermodesulfobacteriota bacterium]
MTPIQAKIGDFLYEAMVEETNSIFNACEILDPLADFARSATQTLARSPKSLESRFLYDARGSELFELICEQPEYYLTRTEASILKDHASHICDKVGPVTLVELGSGSSAKTSHILNVFTDRYGKAQYVPIDISKAALEQAYNYILREHRAVNFVGINGSYECAFPLLSRITPVVVLFLGSSIGNFDVEKERGFWRSMSQCLNKGDYFLLGVDLVKDIETMESAYNDKAGVTAAFTKNLFGRMNREFHSTIEVKHVEHEAEYCVQRERIEIGARFRKAQIIDIQPAGQRFEIGENEKIYTEISRKYRIDRLLPYLSGFGFEASLVLTDPAQNFALLLLRKVKGQ